MAITVLTESRPKHTKISFGALFRNFWTVAILVLAIGALLPIIALVILSIQPTGDIWSHLLNTILPRATFTTMLLLTGVGAMTAIIGIGTAWLVTMCRFPGRSVFDWALLVPLAVPTYIVAYAYVDIMDFTGPVQSLIRSLFGYESASEYWFPEIRTLGGAVFVMSLVLYPYVYLTARANFMLQSTCTLDVSRTLGADPVRLFLRVGLPLARPSITVGISLVLMECLNDIGAVEFFGVRTLTFSIYDTWLNRSSLAGAAQLSCTILLFVFLLLWLERYARRNQRYAMTSSHYRPLPCFLLNRRKSVLAIIACTLPIFLGFVMPALLLLDFASRRIATVTEPAYLSAIGNSLVLSLPAAALTVIFGLVLSYSLRLWHSPVLGTMVHIASIGYAVPGTVLAIGILYPLATFDNLLDGFTRQYLGFAVGLLLTGSGVALIYAYSSRFLAISVGQLESGFGKVSTNLDMASRTLGKGNWQILLQIHIPLLRPVLLSAFLLVFVDCMKELPATILLRPFNFETLATTVYAFASRESFEDSAISALTIVLVGLLPVILLARTSAMPFRNNGHEKSIRSDRETLSLNPIGK